MTSMTTHKSPRAKFKHKPQMTLLSSRFIVHKFKTFRNYHSATPGTLQIFLRFLQLSTTHESPKLTKQCHTQILSFGFTQNPFLATKLISAYATYGFQSESQLVFDSLQRRTVYLYNSLINGYVRNRAYVEAFEWFNRMSCSFVFPDDYTLAMLSKACADIGVLGSGKLVHAKSVRTGFVLDVVVGNSIMTMYSKCGEFTECLKLFDEMPDRSNSSWNVVIAGYVESGMRNFDEKVLGFIKDMQEHGLRPDAFMVSSILCLCDEGSGMWNSGREVHGYMVRNGFGFGSGWDFHMGCCLIDFYSRNGKAGVGRQVFKQMKSRNVFAWTAMIYGYVQNGELEEALLLFRQMQSVDGVEPNSVSLVSVLPACSSLGGLICGKQIHGYAIRRELNCYVPFCNALIDMYCKCGSLNKARQVFDDISFCRDSISWSSMISGYGMHGKGEEAVVLYHQMLQAGNKPDTVTVLGVLTSCGRSGLIQEGLDIYHSAMNEYGIKPTVEICACAVDMLGRSGQLGQAFDFIKAMPVEPGPSVWGALVSASIMHGNSKMHDVAYRFLIDLEPTNPSNYVSLSNLYATSRRWNAVAGIRTTMKELGLKKTPGCSWISIHNYTHTFCVADKLHPCSKSIYEVMNGLVLLMKEAFSSHDFENLI